MRKNQVPAVSESVEDAGASSEPRLTSRLRLGFAAWAALLLLAIFFQLGSRPLFEPDEGRNAEVMREMSLSGDFLVPHLDGVLFLDKPFLYYAAGGLAIRGLGAGELAARLPAVVCTLALAFAIGALARRWWGSRTAILAGFATVATPLALVYTQIVIFDAMLTLWICGAVVALYLAVEREAIPPAEGAEGVDLAGSFRYWAAAAWLAMGLGVLTKGPVALLIPIAAVLPWAIWRGRSRRLVERFAPVALVAVVAPWLLVVHRADPEFLHYALVTETWSRLSSNELNRDAPAWYYLPVVLLGALPWSIVPLAGWRSLARAWKERDRRIRFLLLWFVVPFVLFSLMHSKRVHYILPLVPALVLLSLWIWHETPPQRRLPGALAAAGILAALAIGLLAIGLGAAPQLLKRVEGARPEAVAGVATALGAAWLVGAGLAFGSSRSPVRATFALTLPSVAMLLVTAPLAAGVGERRSSREVAGAIESSAPGVEVVTVETFPASLPFYLGRTVVVVSVDGDPLRSNYISRRFERFASDAGSLRTPEWSAGAIADCRVPRVFLVSGKNDRARQQLVAAGRTRSDVGRGYVLYGACVAETELQPD